ncbi:hypothetical protein JCM13210_09080 [Thermaerobacter litoralis]
MVSRVAPGYVLSTQLLRRVPYAIGLMKTRPQSSNSLQCSTYSMAALASECAEYHMFSTNIANDQGLQRDNPVFEVMSTASSYKDCASYS